MPTGVARLEVVAGNAAGTSILVEDELIVGRHAEGAGRLANDEEISRTHARITLDASGCLEIEDLGSTNGTFVNGLRISSPKTLSQDDGIELGGTTLVVRELPLPSNAAHQPPPADPPPTSTPTPISTPTLAPEPSAPAPATPTPVPAIPASPPVQAPAEPPTAQLPPPLPPLALRLEIDTVAREARIVLDDTSEPVRFRHTDGAWRVIPPGQ